MESVTAFISQHAHHAHWYIFGAIILAGFNFPFSIDILVLISAFLAATLIPEHLFLLFFSILLGCYFSAICSYWFGRIFGNYLLRFRPFAHLLSTERREKMQQFYQKYGLLTLLIGRFIPFGVRNCLFMSSGMSKLSFRTFLLRDALACTIWCTTLFYTFYHLGQNYTLLWHTLKTFNLWIFTAFSVTVIGIIWYKFKKRGRRRASALNNF
jgi:membrane protein DedA with SNARE-associated domain